MTTPPISHRSTLWITGIINHYNEWLLLCDFSTEVKLLDALDYVYLRNTTTQAVPSDVFLALADKTLADIMADVATRKMYFARNNEIRLLNDLVYHHLWHRFAENNATKLLLASMCLKYAYVIDAGHVAKYPAKATFSVLETLLTAWTKRTFVAPAQGHLVDAVADALFGSAWTVLYGGDVDYAISCYEDLLRLQPRLTMDMNTAYPAMSLPCDLT